jgi:hypothetical protein
LPELPLRNPVPKEPPNKACSRLFEGWRESPAKYPYHQRFIARVKRLTQTVLRTSSETGIKMEKTELAEKLLQERIVWADTAHDKGWNDAIDYIVAEYFDVEQGVQPTLLESGKIKAKCPNCEISFYVALPASQSG